MARAKGNILNFNFVKGWNTEASPMTFPANTASDIDNVILDVDGSIRRRGGVNFDDSVTSFADTTSTSDFSSQALGINEWLNVAGTGTLAFTVTQKNNTLYFHRHSGQNTVNNLIGTIDMLPFVINPAKARDDLVSVDSGLGYLFVTSKYREPFYVEYDVDADTLTATKIDIDIRDFDGLDDGLNTDERPSTLSNLHKYNLLNQGWTNTFIVSVDPRNPVSLDDVENRSPIEEVKDDLGVYPSNADIMHLAKVASADAPQAIGAFRSYELEKFVLGNTPAPKGKFILKAFKKNRSSVSGVSGIATESVNVRPSTIAFHNGRAFFAGLAVTGRTGEVYFSQQLTNIKKVGRCYQEADPTSEEISDLVATDGGLITIPGAGLILRLMEGPDGILVFAKNGIWQITGTEGKFSAVDFFVRKVTDIGCSGAETVVNADGTFLYWSDSGIIALTRDQVSGNLNAENITKNTIQTGYLLIGGIQRKFARGVFITEEKKAVWLYSTEASYDGITDRWRMNGALILDMQLGAFYKYSISDLNADAAPYVVGITKTSPFISTLSQLTVTENGVAVTENGVNVTVSEETFSSTAEISSWKLLCVRRTFATAGAQLGLTFGEFSSTTWKDWSNADGTGVDYTSLLETGFDLGGNPMQDKQPKYVFAYLSSRSKSVQTGGYFELLEGTQSTFFCGDLSAMTYNGNSFDVSSQTGDPMGFDFNSDGTLLVIADQLNDTVFEYSLSTAFDVTTASYTGNTFDLSGQTANIEDFVFADSGNKFYTVNLVSDSVFQYNLTTAYDITTAIYSGNSFNVSSQSNNPQAVLFNDTGNKMYTLSAVPDKVSQWSLSTNWDVTTATFASKTLDVSSETDFPESMTFSSTGKVFYLLSQTPAKVFQYNLTTAYDISTATYSGKSFSVGQDTAVRGVRLETEGNKVFITGQTNNKIFEYDLDCS